jgi:hypothetical protein
MSNCSQKKIVGWYDVVRLEIAAFGKARAGDQTSQQ